MEGKMIKKMLKLSPLIIVLSIALTAFFGIQMRNIAIENTVRLYMPQDSESYKNMLKAEEDFGSMMVLGVSLETKNDTIITPQYLSIVQKISEQIESVENVESIDSITNIDYIVGQDGYLIAENLLGGDNYTGTDEDMRLIKQKIIDWQEMYNRVILNDDGKTTQLMILLHPKEADGTTLSAQHQTDALHAIQEITEREVKGSDLEVRYFGDPVLTDDAHDFMMSDLTILIPFVALIVLLSLYFSFHTWSGTLLPLITVLMATVWSVGIMCMLNITFTIVGSMIPVTLIACGSAYGIHVLTHYYIALDKIEGEVTKEKHADAIAYGLKDVWIAVLLAAITTIAGFISNVTSPIRPLRSFSVFAASGVAFALLLSVTLIPALLYVKPVKSIMKNWKNKDRPSLRLRAKIERELARRRGKTTEEAQANTLYHLYFFFAGTKARLVVFMLALVILSIVGLNKLTVDTALVNYFPNDSKFRQDIAYVDDNLAGSNTMYLVISGQEIKESQTPVETASDDFGDFGAMFDEAAESPDAAASESDSSDAGDFGDFGDMFAADESAGGEAAVDDFGFPIEGGDESVEVAAARYPLTDTEILSAVDGLQEYLKANFDGIGKMVSFTTFIKRMNQVMNAPAQGSAQEDFLQSKITVEEGLALLHGAYAAAGGDTATVEGIVKELEKRLNYQGAAYYEIPFDPAKYPVESREELNSLVSQYLMLLGSDQIKRFADDMATPSAIRTQVQLRTHSSDDTGKIIAAAKDYAEKYFPRDEEGNLKYTLTATGNGEMEYTMTKMVVESQITSIIFSLVMVFIIIALSFKSAWAGIVGAIPLGLVILLNFMVMGFAGINLDLCTSVVASVAIGVGIDYTIHFMETYKAERAKTKDLETVVQNTLKTSGKGIITNALAVGLGFCVLLFSKFIILRYIGALVAVVMFTSSAGAMTLIPGILNAFDFKFMWPKEERETFKADIKAEKEEK